MATVLERETRAALQGIQSTLPVGSVDSEWLPTPLARIGDALRLGMPIPVRVLRWAEGLKASDLARAIRAVCDEVDTWSVPERVGEDDPELVFVVRRRDEVESVQTAVVRICVARRLVPGTIENFIVLQNVLRDFDGRLKKVVSRSMVRELLGERVVLQGEHGWTAALGDEEDTALESTSSVRGESLEWNDAVLAFPPSDESVIRYAVDGALARYIEGFAEKSEEFAEELAAVIDGLIECGEPLSLTARRWRRYFGGRFPTWKDPLVLPVVPALRLAAASEAVDPERCEIRLGRLAPLDAEARLVCTARTATLWVYPGRMILQRVQFGEAVAGAPEPDGDWRVEIPVRDGPIVIRVVANSGESFEIEVRLEEIGND